MCMRSDNPFLPFVEDFEKEAEQFLISYGLEELIYKPSPIPIKNIIEKRMLLNIIDDQLLSSNLDVKGIISFSDGIVDVYDYYEEEYVGYKLTEATILVDANYKNSLYKNIILAHEAYHWYKHRKYYIYQSKQGLSDEFAFRCNNKTIYTGSNWTDEQKMEWQANKIAPLILIPKKSVIKKIQEFVGEDFISKDITEYVEKFADFYNVTVRTMAIRLKSLGYIVQDSSFSDFNHLIKSNKKNYGGESYITIKEGFELFQKDKIFRKYIESGLFKFDDNQIVYVAKGAKYNRPLLFRTVLVATNIQEQKGLMFKKNLDYKSKKVFSKQPNNVELYPEIEKSKTKFIKEHERKASNYKSANEQLLKLMEEEKWNVTIFQDKTLLSSMDYSRIKKPEHIFKLPHYVAMAVGLELSLSEFELIIACAGYSLISGNIEHDCYSFILSTLNGCGIDVCNDFLESMNLKPLGTQSRDWKDYEYGANV